MADRRSMFYAGLDVGGSTIKAVLIDNKGVTHGEIIETESLVKHGYKTTFKQLEKALDQLIKSAGIEKDQIRGIGLDVPAPNSDGVIWGQANLGADWVGINICKEFSDYIGLPAHMTNDVNAAAIGEYNIRGNCKKGLLFVAPGTGLGGGFVLPNGHLYEGANGLALEVGHISVPFMEEDGQLPACSCGLKGCAEAWVSLVALRRRLRMELEKEVWSDHPLNSDEITIEQKAFQLRDYAENKDALAIKIFKEQGFILGYAIADMVRLFDPGLVVIGGGLAETSFREKYISWVEEGFKDRAWSMYIRNPLNSEEVTTSIEWAYGKDHAAALGMAFVAMDLFQ